MPTKTRSRSQNTTLLEGSSELREIEVRSRALALDSDERSEELANASAARPPAGLVEEAVDRAA
ncbi:MAG: hypothetical protein ACRDKL_01290, partial [Solirubrobacteraceae bacterium]